ncbi:MAG: sulfite exporter TauE/SafE family protein [Candidatus Syntropharchaeia archaeon]
MVDALALGFIVIFVAFFIRTLTGFGSALIAVPLLSVIFSPKIVIPFLLVYECLISLLLIFSDRTSVEIKRMVPMIASGIAGIPLGTYILVSLDVSHLRIFIGITVVIFSFLLLRRKIAFKKEKLASIIAGTISGIFGGSTGINGPPIVIFLANQGWKKDFFRKGIIIYLTIVDLFLFTSFSFAGLITEKVLYFDLIFFPAIFLGFISGKKLFLKIEENSFEKIVIAVSILTGISCMFWGLFTGCT